MGKTVNLSNITVQTGVERTVFVSWTVSSKLKHIDKYEVAWTYLAQGKWFAGSTATVEHNSTTPKTSTYGYPDNADTIQVKVKPVSKTYKKNNKDTHYWDGSWVTKKRSFDNLRPDKPGSGPSLELAEGNNYKAIAKISVSDTKTTSVKFEFVNAETGGSIKSITAKVIAGQASAQISVTAGVKYRARCCGINDNTKKPGDYSEWSDDLLTGPGAISNPPVVIGSSGTSFQIQWAPAANADGYTVEYTQKERYFDNVPDRVKSAETVGSWIEIFDPETDPSINNRGEYFVRVKAKKGNLESGWSPVGSGRVGQAPDPPTTWSSSASGSPGDPMYLYWTHNSVDGSRERKATLYLNINGTVTTQEIPNTTQQDQDTGTHRYSLDTSKLTDGAVVKWKVQTMGAIDTWSGYSAEREINIYAPPTLTIGLISENRWYWDTLSYTDDANIYTAPGEMIPLPVVDGVTEMHKFPLWISLTSYPRNQTPVTYSISITADETYNDIDDIGNQIKILAGQEVYTKFIVTSDYEVLDYILPNEIDLRDDISYTVRATVAMDSGLGADATAQFTFQIDRPEYMDIGFAETLYDEDLVALSIMPRCLDEDENPIPGYLLSVYRKEADGSFVEIGSDLPSLENTYVNDPHPTLGWVNYRIVAINEDTGTAYFEDAPSYPIPEKSILIQWDEQYQDFSGETLTEDELLEQPIQGTILRLPYNVDVQDATSPDVSFVNYIGRKHPVSYYGTSLGQTGSWSCEIPKDDTETIFKLRRLAAWMGDVYVREPSGLGYWAQVVPSFNLEHCRVTVPVSFAITRVEGGV